MLEKICSIFGKTCYYKFSNIYLEILIKDEYFLMFYFLSLFLTSLLFCFLILILKHIFKAYPNTVKFVLSFLQIFFSVIKKVVNIVIKIIFIRNLIQQTLKSLFGKRKMYFIF